MHGSLLEHYSNGSDCDKPLDVASTGGKSVEDALAGGASCWPARKVSQLAAAVSGTSLEWAPGAPEAAHSTQSCGAAYTVL